MRAREKAAKAAERKATTEHAEALQRLVSQHVDQEKEFASKHRAEWKRKQSDMKVCTSGVNECAIR